MKMSLDQMKGQLNYYTNTRQWATNLRNNLSSNLHGVTNQEERKEIADRIKSFDSEIAGCNEMIRTLTSHIRYYNS